MFKKIILSLAVVAVVFSSCKKEFLDTFSSTAVADVDAVKTTANAYIALNGIHRILTAQYDNQPEGGESAVNVIRDLMGEDFINPNPTGRLDFANIFRWIGHRDVANGNQRFVYRFYYRVIANANVLINGIDAASGPDADKRMIKGQALAYRAWAHFNLVQLWGERFDATKPNDGLGVPLMTKSTLIGQPRATVAAVYSQVNADLDLAITLLAGYNRSGSAPKTNINQAVAQGFKARVALAQQNWAVAATNAAAARASFTLMTNASYTTGFNDITNLEWMWGSKIISETTPFFYQYHSVVGTNYPGSAARTQPKVINRALHDALPSTDIRKQVWVPSGLEATIKAGVPWPAGAAGNGYFFFPYHSKKFFVPDVVALVGDVPMMRAAEMYLIEAEARARQGGQEAAARTALFTLVKNRDANYILSTNSGQALIDEIMFHRRIELWGEGFRFTDLKRLNLPLDRTSVSQINPSIYVTMNVPAGDKLWIFLFHQDEINTNSALIQNPL